MPNGAYAAGTRFGFLPGSADAGKSLYGPMYQGVFGAMEPGPQNQGGYWWEDEQDRQTARNRAANDYGNKQDLWDKLMGNIGRSSINASSNSQPIPGPNYASTAPIWSQGQINAQANQQRAQMQAQAANATRGYATSAAARGFSPMSPLTQFMQQVNNQRANIGAAQNETNLNWMAAEGNRGAQQRGEGINAGLYGSYTSALARQRDQQLQAQAMQQSYGMDQYRLLASLLGR